MASQSTSHSLPLLFRSSLYIPSIVFSLSTCIFTFSLYSLNFLFYILPLFKLTSSFLIRFINLLRCLLYSTFGILCYPSHTKRFTPISSLSLTLSTFFLHSPAFLHFLSYFIHLFLTPTYHIDTLSFVLVFVQIVNVNLHY